MSEIELIRRFEEWYSAHCDGDWEHSRRVRVSTIDNPGWSVNVNITGTALEYQPFERVKVDRTEEDWFSCRIEEGEFKGWGGARNLSDLLRIFLEWAELYSVPRQ